MVDVAGATAPRAVGRSRTAFGRVFLVLTFAFSLVAGAWFKAGSLSFATSSEDYLVAAYRSFAYSDIIALYLRTQERSEGHRPYFDEGFEYPVVTAGLHYLGVLTGDVTRSFYLQSFVLAVAAASLLWSLLAVPGARPWLFVLSPALLLHGFMNWDLLALAPLGLAIVAAKREQAGLSGTLLTIGIWAKLLPGAIVPALLGYLVRSSSAAGVFRAVLALVLVTIGLNGPIIGLDYFGWESFLRFGAERQAHSTIWNLLGVPGQLVNQLGVLAVAVGLIGSMIAVRRSPERWLFAGTFLLVWWLLWNKAASPQYSLYVVFLLALLGAPWPLLVWHGLLDVFYFVTSFQSLVLWNVQDLESLARYEVWFVQPVVIARILTLAAIAIWLAFRASQTCRIASRTI